ncbi:MAG: 2-amino-4-hydroxy-6-hydroxymethyldihydropteridine diphosphokinase [bacterium]|nr:2-amino-4-hydroxy-6-hydroxymethyldihydropteridine diphosphokinase [bacterium]
MWKWRSRAVGQPVEHAYVGFGSNLGDGRELFAAALSELTGRGLRVLRCSALYETQPWGGAPGGDYTNAVLEVERAGEVREFLRVLQSVEVALGRTRREPNAPRTCDLDLLLWGSDTMDSPELVVPHPRLGERRFVLLPLCDLIPDGVHPRFNRTFRELLRVCPDSLRVRRIGAPNFS